MPAHFPLAPTGNSSPSRRSLLRGALLGLGGAVAGGALTACATADAAEGAGTLQMWDLFQGSDGALMYEVLDAARRRMPGLSVKRTVLEWGTPYYTKLSMASVGGRGPDMAISHMSRLAALARSGLLDPWDLDLMARYGVHRDDYASSVWPITQYGGHTYAMPLDTHPFIVFFHPDIARRAGLLDDDGALDPGAFSSPERFLSSSRALARASGHEGVAFGHANDPSQCWRLFYALYRQTGEAMTLTPGSRAGVDLDRMTEVVAFMSRLLDGRTNPRHLDYNAGIASFVNRRTGLILSGEWELATFRTADPKVDAAPFPTVFDHPAVYADSHSFVLPHHPDPGPERRRRVHETVAAVLRSGQVWAKAGHIPAYRPVTRTAAYRALRPQRDYVAAQAHTVFDPVAWFTGAASDFQNQMSQTLQTALIEDVPPAQVARTMVRKLDGFLTQPDPSAP
ncbi:ABC transporter substrate-binding protein [Streptomyces sp. NPDC059740]|uniref:ABC transporter substrate-binding protein n=1 Tax=Streptomyces sp. NPDC059740 TaxID=3346926 RepID=UPI003650292E